MNLMELFVALAIDHSAFDRGMQEAQDAASGFGSKLKSGLTAAAKATAAAITGTATAAVNLGKQVSASYADYEQLVGGVETLFGSEYQSVEEYAAATGLSLEKAASSFEAYQSRASDVLKNADNAYMTSGLSANEYMETVTSFAAALNSSLGENAWQSANYADMAIQDMAD